MSNFHDDSHHLVNGAQTASPNVNIFLRPIAAPAALGLAAYAGSTWIVSSWLANWWYGSPGYFFPFVMIWGGLAQFIAGQRGFHARDILVTVFHTLWGSFYLSIGLVWLLVTVGALPYHGFREHFSEIAAWMVVLMVFTWICAIGAFARDMIYFATLTTLALGSTLATGGYYAHGLSGTTIKAAAYFWMISSFLATWRVAAYVWEENYGTTAVPIFRSRRERNTNWVDAGLGEPGVKRGMPKIADRHTGAGRNLDGRNGVTGNNMAQHDGRNGVTDRPVV